jgi:chloride channel protein, CIC family
MQLSNTTKEILFLLFAMFIGALASVGALLFRGAIEVGQWLLWPPGQTFLAQVEQAPWWLKLGLPILGGLALGPVVTWYVPELRGPGVPQVIEAAALRDGYIRPQVTILKPLFTALIIATGGSVGREGPAVHIGSAIGSNLAQALELPSEKKRICLACGAAAGIASLFNAPFAGTLFVVEIILSDLEIAYLGHIVLASVTSVTISRHFRGDFPAFQVSKFVPGPAYELFFYLLLGILAGLVALVFIKAVFAAEDVFKRLPVPAWLQPAVGGLCLGLIGLFLTPNVYGVGHDSTNLALAGKVTLFTAIFLLVCKMAATVCCLGSGMSGGIFAPSLCLGAMLGTGVALTLNSLWPYLHLRPTDYALVGMGALVSGTTLGPITAIMTLFELTNTERIIVPLMAGCITAFLTVKYLYGYSIYETKLRRQGINIVRGHEINILRSIKVKDYVRTRFEILFDNTPLHDILERAENSPYPYFVVLDARRELSGVLTLWDLRQVLLETDELGFLTVAQELKSSPAVTITSEDNFETAMNIFEGHRFSFLPVVRPEDPRQVVGILTREDLINAHNQRVVKNQMLKKGN